LVNTQLEIKSGKPLKIREKGGTSGKQFALSFLIENFPNNNL
jgi:hypothetical protein